MSLDRHYQILNAGDGSAYDINHYHIRQFKHRFEKRYLGDRIEEGLFPIPGSPNLKHNGYYHVHTSGLDHPWWKKPSKQEQEAIRRLYPGARF